MSGNFEWQTEDEDNWQELSAEEVANTKTKRRRRWRYVLFIALIMSLAGTTIYWRVQSAVRQAEEVRSGDVLSSYNLLGNAILTHDSELFVTLLSGADLSWADTLQDLFQRGWINDRRFIGLGMSQSEQKPPSIELSPELTSAVVSTIAVYDIVNSDGSSHRIQLRNDTVYRLGRRWLLAPAEASFWGGQVSVDQHRRITSVNFPERDRSIVEGMLEYLDDGIEQICQSTGYMNCPRDLEVEIEFSIDPKSLIKTMESYLESGFYQMGLRRPGSKINLILPTPTLVGIPVDAASYQAVKRGYGAYVAGAVVNRYLDESCCNSDPLLQAKRQALLADLGMLPWPLEEPFISQTANPAVNNYDVAVMCQQGSTDLNDLYTFDIDTGEWRLTLEDRQLVEMQSLPDGRGVALLEKVPQANDIILVRLLILLEGKELVLSEQYADSPEGWAARFEVRDRGQILLMEVPRLEEGFTDFSVLNLVECETYDCDMATYSLYGRPYWSPDGDQWLVREFGQLWKREGFMSSLVSDGFAPFWLNSDIFGYVRMVGDEQFIVTINANTGEPEQIYPMDVFSGQLPDLSQGTRLRVAYIMPDPAQPFDHWFLLFFLVDRLGHYDDAVIMDFNLKTNDVEIVHQSDQLNKLALSDKGDVLALSFFDPGIQQWQILVHKTGMAENPIYTLTTGSSSSQEPSLAWSPDNLWLAVFNKGLLTILSGDGRNQFDVIPPVAGCLNAAWLRPGR